MKRIILVYNPNSSRYIDVQEEVISKVQTLKGYMIGKYAIKKAPFEENVKNLTKLFKNGDLAIAAGGDATAAVTANAIMLSKKDVTLGVLPYGNFNDLARTLGTMKYEDLRLDSTWAGDAAWGTPSRALARMGENAAAGPAQKISNQGPVQKSPAQRNLYPLDIIVDGKHWRYATCYVTMGMTAEAVELFDDPKFRKKMQKGHKSSWRSYLALVKWYFKFRHSKIFIPDFSINGKPAKPGVSDYCALSGKSMCRVMKGGYDFLNPKIFRSHNCRLLSFWGISTLMLKSILFRTPGTETTGDKIVFNSPATVELQAEGEYKVFKNAKTIEVKKTGQPIKVIMKGGPNGR